MGELAGDRGQGQHMVAGHAQRHHGEHAVESGGVVAFQGAAIDVGDRVLAGEQGVGEQRVRAGRHDQRWPSGGQAQGVGARQPARRVTDARQAQATEPFPHAAAQLEVDGRELDLAPRGQRIDDAAALAEVAGRAVAEQPDAEGGFCMSRNRFRCAHFFHPRLPPRMRMTKASMLSLPLTLMRLSCRGSGRGARASMPSTVVTAVTWPTSRASATSSSP